MKKFFKITGIVLLVLIVLIGAGLIYFNLSYPKTDPAPNIKINATPEKLERGKYLAMHVAMCMDCHSTRDWKKYSGPIMPGTEGKGGEKLDEAIGFPGTIYVKNITPAALHDWTDGEIIRAITRGVNKYNTALFPTMPYYNFNKMTQEDVEAIVAYVRSLKPIKNDVPDKDLNFPLNFIVKTLPIQTYKPPKPVDKTNSPAYGKYLVTIASCEECHTPSKEGEPVPGMNFAGGMEIKLPHGTIRSANISPDNETGIGNWTKEMFIARFKSFESDSAKNIPADIYKEFNTIMPWTLYAGMTNEDLAAIYDYLRTVKPVKHRVERYTPAKNEFSEIK
ncbi:MAG TPA: c-type cytochrome [Ignavibacteriaceae bacterium]|nr:c-type cytochrome [Ignavibacteriaceae bacterium]